jgi:FlaA1/EpsC-like NDP-sugar epimerase
MRADTLLIVTDIALTAAAYLFAMLVRFDGTVPGDRWPGFLSFLPIAVVVTIAADASCGLYRQLWRHASIVEARRILLAGFASGTVLLLVHAVLIATSNILVPFSVVIAGAGLSLAFAGALRFQSRLMAFRRQDSGSQARRVAIVGAGRAGAALVRDMLAEPHGGFRPVVMFDDDLRKQGRFCHGVPVAGPIADLVSKAADFAVDQLVLTIHQCPPGLAGRVAELADVAGVPIRILPPPAERIRADVTMRDVRDLRIDDLLDRDPVVTDLGAVKEMIGGRVVLITGAGGSIGAEIARQVSAFAPARLLLLDHDETHLHDVCSTLRFPARQLLVDVRDGDQLRRLLALASPDLVFHAAAHKHVPVLEQHPCEAAGTNVVGTANVVRACQRSGVPRLVLISTDKAVRPRSVMGASKRVAEHLVLGANPTGGRYCAVRFGNVLGSRGSVVPTFLRQVAAGGPVTVTDARMTRFFMSVAEAVQLVLNAAALADGGEIFMLEMGSPVRIIDLAQRVIRLAGWRSGTDIEVRVTGIRPGEKVHEELRTPEEVPEPTFHPKIVRLRPALLPSAMLRAALAGLRVDVAVGDEAAVRDRLFRLAAGPAAATPPAVPVHDDGVVIEIAERDPGTAAAGGAAVTGQAAVAAERCKAPQHQEHPTWTSSIT